SAGALIWTFCWLERNQLDPEVTKPVEQPNTGAPGHGPHRQAPSGWRRVPGPSLDGGLGALAQPSQQNDAVSARAHRSASVHLRVLGTGRYRNSAGGVFPGLGDRPGGVDEADMAERLREVADQFSAGRVDLLGQQAHVVDRG